jgi:hypothetical protein
MIAPPKRKTAHTATARVGCTIDSDTFRRQSSNWKRRSDENRSDGTVLHHLGDAYRKVGKTDKAAAAWRRSVDTYEKDKETEKAKKASDKSTKIK